MQAPCPLEFRQSAHAGPLRPDRSELHRRARPPWAGRASSRTSPRNDFSAGFASPSDGGGPELFFEFRAAFAVRSATHVRSRATYSPTSSSRASSSSIRASRSASRPEPRIRSTKPGCVIRQDSSGTTGSLAHPQKTELVIDAIGMAILRRRPAGESAILHSVPHGIQYTSCAFGKRLRDAGLLRSMGTVGNCCYNSIMESFRERCTQNVFPAGRRGNPGKN